MYRRLNAFDGTGTPNQLITISSGHAQFSSKQASKHLLCRGCEDLFGTRERYASMVLLQDDDRFPLADQGSRIVDDGTDGVVELSSFDTEKITYFVISIFWRADVAQIEPIVDLYRDRDLLRRFLLGESRLPPSVDLVASLLRPQPGLPRADRLIAFPQTQLDGKMHLFIGCGCRFQLYTDTSLPETLIHYSMPRYQLAFSGSGQETTELISNNAKASEKTGKLAALGI